MPCLLTETVLETITAKPRTANQLAHFLNVEKRAVYRHTAILLKQGLIESKTLPGMNEKIYSVLTPTDILE